MTSKRRDTIDAINEAYRVVCTAYSKLRAERDAALSELADAKAENVALWRVYDAARDVIRFTEPEWRNDVDRGDADTKLAEALAAVPPRAVKGEQDNE